MTRCSLKNDVAQPPADMATRRPSGLGSVSVTRTELGNVSSVVVERVVGSKRMVVPVQLFGLGPQPAISLVHRGPELIVIHTSPRLSTCGLATCAPEPLDTVANAPSRWPCLSENCSSTTLFPQAHAGHSEMNDPCRDAPVGPVPLTEGDGPG